MALWSMGGGRAGAAGTALFSNLAGAHEQGEAMGTNQALQGLMRVIGPLWGGWAYQHTAGLLPLGEAYRGEASGAIVQYLVPGVLTLIIAVMVWRLVPRAGGGAGGGAEVPAAGEGRELP
ncbi:MAG: hypothetical protein MUE97_08350 [Phycisphaerales bacterium]|nr:hypothetical protein [Phycisphaerales bacterium]